MSASFGHASATSQRSSPSAFAQPARSASSGPVTPTALPPAPVTTTSAMLIVEPSTIGSNDRLTSVPSPAASEAPDISKPSTIPVAELNETSLRSPEAPVRVTPETSNWNPYTSTLLL